MFLKGCENDSIVSWAIEEDKEQLSLTIAVNKIYIESTTAENLLNFQLV